MEHLSERLAGDGVGWMILTGQQGLCPPWRAVPPTLLFLG